MRSIDNVWNWQPPSHWAKISTIDMHTGGEPLRILLSGLPPIQGRTVLEKRRYFTDKLDRIRTGTMWEPRGHADMYGAVMTPSEDADFDVFFLHNEGYSTMCGHAIIALTTFAMEAGLVEHHADSGEYTHLSFNVPAGRINARARVAQGRARDVSFLNVPSFLYLKDRQVNVPGIGHIHFDVAYGGAFYAIVEATHLGLELVPEEFDRLVNYGRLIKLAVINNFSIEHPLERDLSFLYGTIFTGPPHDRAHHSRNVCIFAGGELDRSPTGSGVSARGALHYAKGELRLNETITIESILGSTMAVRIVEQTALGPHDAVVPEVFGSAHFTGRSEFWIDPGDPLKGGFIFR
jgi:proline racemase